MKNEENLISINRSLTAEQLRRLFDRLDDEATPYALRVGKGENHLKAITIYCDGKDEDYFTNILNNEI